MELLQGNCTANMPSLAALSLSTAGPDLLPQKPGQCLLSGFSSSAVYVGAKTPFSIWIDNLYVREDDSAYAKLWMIKFWGDDGQYPSGYLTNLTVQGNGKNDTAAGLLLSGPSFAEGMLLPRTSLHVTRCFHTALMVSCDQSLT